MNKLDNEEMAVIETSAEQLSDDQLDLGSELINLCASTIRY